LKLANQIKNENKQRVNFQPVKLQTMAAEWWHLVGSAGTAGGWVQKASPNWLTRKRQLTFTKCLVYARHSSKYCYGFIPWSSQQPKR
jgi:hypothetical protein